MTRAFAFSINLAEPGWREMLPNFRALIGKAARTTLKSEGVEAASISFALMDDAQIQELNHQFRGKNVPTNVLSFEDDSDENFGDIALALETIQREATDQNKTLEAHFVHLVVHGVMHLLGYDHMQQYEAEEMETKEIAILSVMGIENPYIAR